MLKRCEKTYRVFAPREGGGAGEELGYYPLSLSGRTSEEVESGDIMYTNYRLAAFAEKTRAPAGGYKRGMILTGDGGEEYHVLLAAPAGRLWNLKLERVVYGGE